MKRSEVMSRIRSRGNKDTELVLVTRTLRGCGQVLRIWEHTLQGASKDTRH